MFLLYLLVVFFSVNSLFRFNCRYFSYCVWLLIQFSMRFDHFLSARSTEMIQRHTEHRQHTSKEGKSKSIWTSIELVVLMWVLRSIFASLSWSVVIMYRCICAQRIILICGKSPLFSQSQIHCIAIVDEKYFMLRLEWLLLFSYFLSFHVLVFYSTHAERRTMYI